MDQKIIGIGCDLVNISRFRSVRYPDRVAELVFSKKEYSEYRESADALQYLASRFAVKESVIKACPQKVSPRDFQVTKVADKPAIEWLTEKDVKFEVLVTLSHEQEFALAYACAILK